MYTVLAVLAALATPVLQYHLLQIWIDIKYAKLSNLLVSV
jgi:hypothetical protein